MGHHQSIAASRARDETPCLAAPSCHRRAVHWPLWIGHSKHFMTTQHPIDAEEVVLPLLEEDLVVSRRQATRPVRVHVRTVTREETVDEPVSSETVEVERVPVNQPTESVPPIRREGDLTIIPVVEEVLVVERRLVIKEEIHLRHVRKTERHRQTVTLRRQEAEVERGADCTTPEGAEHG